MGVHITSPINHTSSMAQYVTRLCLVQLVTLFLAVQCLNPEAYGLGKEGLEKYGAAYAKARESRYKMQKEGPQDEKEEILEQTYQERYTISVQPRAQSCFYLEDLEEGYRISVHYVVLSTKGGEQMDIGMNLRDSTGKFTVFQGRKKEDHFV